MKTLSINKVHEEILERQNNTLTLFLSVNYRCHVRSSLKKATKTERR